MKTSIKVLIWLYIFLLIFEGALRKWFFPSLSDELLIVRDPVLLAIYGLAYRAGLAKNDRLATAHFWVSAVGAILFPIGEGIAISGGNIALAVVGSLLVILSGVQFVVAVYRA